MYLVFAQLLKSYAPISLACPPVESNTLELSNALICHGTWLSFLLQPIVVALLRNPKHEPGFVSVLLWREAVGEFRLVFTQFFKQCFPRSITCLPVVPISLGWPPVETDFIECSNALRWHATWGSVGIQPRSGVLSVNPLPELGVGSVLLWDEAVAELFLKFAQLLKSYAPNECTCLPFESNTLELSNTLLCHVTGLSFLIQPVVVALSVNPLPELGVGSVLLWDEAVAELLEFAQLLKSYAPNGCTCPPFETNTLELSNTIHGCMCPPFESNTLELSNTILCHATGLSFLIQPVIVALIRNPLPELGVGSVLLWDEAVAELDLEFAQLLKSYAPNGCQLSLACSPVKANTIECSNVLSCHRSCLCFFVFLPLLMTLSLGVGRIPSWHKIVTKLNIAFPPALWSC